MRIPKGPFQGATNALLYALLMGGDCMEYRKILVAYDQVSTLDPPEGTQYAMIILEAELDPLDPDLSKPVVRICESASIEASSSVGMPVSHLSIIDIKGEKNLENFTASGIENGKLHTLHVQFYG